MLRTSPAWLLAALLIPACTADDTAVLDTPLLSSAHTAGHSVPDRCVTLMAAGDILLDRGVRKKAFIESDPAYPLKHLPSIFQGADLAIANLECALTRRDTAYGKIFTFKADPDYARLLRKAGITALTLANNHAYDYGRGALIETIEALEKNDLIALGAGFDLERASRPHYVKANGLTIALLGFVTMPLEGIVFLKDRPTPAVAVRNLVARRLKEARRQADFVVVTAHWGTEFTALPDADQLEWATFFRKHGADLIVGHHPHVLQTVEAIGKQWTFYSLGNFIFDQPTEPRNLALVARVRFCKGGIEEIGAVPIEIKSTRPMLAGPEAASKILTRLRQTSPDLELNLRNGLIEMRPRPKH